ncbi:hypothetical protein [Streptomyces sp. NPDC048659]|uniref:hypothetical protein n=1 Tax=Streptomyces sp. NPDC048659 TaxID=3155489 RepID=UPI0034192494
MNDISDTKDTNGNMGGSGNISGSANGNGVGIGIGNTESATATETATESATETATDTDDAVRDHARARVDALIAAGALAEARALARRALDADGPDAALFLALARAHLAEDADDHDDAAERVYREGLDAFPDHIALLAAYAELCVRTDAIDRPARHNRGPALLARLRELAPDSPELLRAETAGDSVVPGAKTGAAAYRVQSFDAVRAFADAPTPAAAAARAAHWSKAAPHDTRLAVLAETTATLAVGPPWARLLLRRGLELRIAAALVAALLIVLRLTALPGLPYGLPTALVLVAGLPSMILRKRLREARTRAAGRLAAAVPRTEAEPTDLRHPELPPVPRVTRREYVFSAIALAILLGVGGVSYAASLAYPRYELVEHDTFRGLKGYLLREEFDPLGSVPWDESQASTARMYLPDDAGPGAAAEYLVAVTTGDFHAMDESFVDGDAVGLVPGGADGIGVVQDDWRAGSGPYAGWMRCFRYTEVRTGTPRALCVWGDKGSVGMVLFTAKGQSREEVERSARTIGAAFFRPAAD